MSISMFLFLLAVLLAVAFSLFGLFYRRWRYYKPETKTIRFEDKIAVIKLDDISVTIYPNWKSGGKVLSLYGRAKRDQNGAGGLKSLMGDIKVREIHEGSTKSFPLALWPKYWYSIKLSKGEIGPNSYLTVSLWRD
jgi:hypothetical protein